jgi:hypothetical protein
MFKMNTIVLSHILMTAVILSGIGPPLGSSQAAPMTDPAEDLSEQLWKDKNRRDSVIQVHINGPDMALPFGTAFMITDVYAATAAHVVCDPDMGKTKSFSLERIELRIGGPGASPIRPEVVSCSWYNADFAIMKVPPLNSGRPHLELGAYEDLAVDHFISIFGYGGNQPGRPLKGNAAYPPLDNANRVRADISSSPGDSGAPVIGQDGRAVGVLTAGNVTGTTTFVPFREFSDKLADLSITVPDARKTAVVSVSPGRETSKVSGIVKIMLARALDGTWPAPPWRVASQGEAQILFTLHNPSGDDAVLTTMTESGGSWSIEPAMSIPDGGLRYGAIVSGTVDTTRTPMAALYRADTIAGQVTREELTTPIELKLFARSAYVREKMSIATGGAQILQSDPFWGACAAILGSMSAESQTCPAKTLYRFERQIRNIDDAFRHAFDASADEPGDIEITTSIAAVWSNFRVTYGRPCSATAIMRDLFDKFSDSLLSPRLITQNIDMILRCLSIGPKSPLGVLPWRWPGESRQAAAVRLMLETLDHFAQSSESLRGQ